MDVRQMLSVLAVFALLGGALFALRRGSLGSLGLRTFDWESPRWSSLRLARAPARTKSLATMERLALTPLHSLHLVRIQGREMVVATHPHGCTVLSNGYAVLNDNRTPSHNGLNDGVNDERSLLNADRTLMNDGRALLSDPPAGLRP
jgi:hypothetical protein